MTVSGHTSSAAVSRRLLGSAAVVGGAALTVPAGAAAHASAPPPLRGGRPAAPEDPLLDRAHRAVMAMASRFGAADGSGLLHEQHPAGSGDPEYSYLWPFSQARAAAVELSHAYRRVPQDLADLVARLERAQEHYWKPNGGTTGLPGYAPGTGSAQGAGGDIYYDDNDWIGLLEVEEHLLSRGRRGDLTRARQILELERSAEDSDPSHPSPGGLFWTQAASNHDRNTVSNYPAAKLALRLAAITRDRRPLEDAQRWMSWARTTLLSPAGLFWDHIALDGTIEKTFWAYNQGVPIGAHALLYQLTRDSASRDQAFELVEACRSRFAADRPGEGLDKQPPEFVAIHLQNLLLAESVLGATVGGKEAVDAVAQRWWDERRDPETDLYRDPNGRAGAPVHLLWQAGFARILSLAALPRTAWSRLS